MTEHEFVSEQRRFLGWQRNANDIGYRLQSLFLSGSPVDPKLAYHIARESAHSGIIALGIHASLIADRTPRI